MIIAIRFKDAIVGAVSRLERIEAFGQKLELQKTLDQLEAASSLLTPGDVIGPTAAASAAESHATEAVQLPLDTGDVEPALTDAYWRQWLEANPDRFTAAIRQVIESELSAGSSEVSPAGFAAFQRRVLKSAMRTPRSAITQLSLAMRSVIDEIAESSGNYDLNADSMSPDMKATELEERGVLSPLAGDAIRNWHMVRGLLRSESKTNDDMHRAIDSGLAIISAMQNSFHLPDEVYDFHRNEGKSPERRSNETPVVEP